MSRWPPELEPVRTVRRTCARGRTVSLSAPRAARAERALRTHRSHTFSTKKITYFTVQTLFPTDRAAWCCAVWCLVYARRVTTHSEPERASAGPPDARLLQTNCVTADSPRAESYIDTGFGYYAPHVRSLINV